MHKRQVLLVLGLIFLAGCTGMKIDDFANRRPILVLEDYFEGETRAWGVFEDRFGNLRREFEVTILGTFENDVLTLDEHFAFADGETDRRVWKIRKTGAKTYEGEADDVIGKASGRAAGNAVNWVYDIDLEIGGRTVRVRFNDWLFLQSSGVLINRARVTKWGIEIGQVTLFFQRDESLASSANTQPIRAAAE